MSASESNRIIILDVSDGPYTEQFIQGLNATDYRDNSIPVDRSEIPFAVMREQQTKWQKQYDEAWEKMDALLVGFEKGEEVMATTMKNMKQSSIKKQQMKLLEKNNYKQKIK